MHTHAAGSLPLRKTQSSHPAHRLRSASMDKILCFTDILALACIITGQVECQDRRVGVITGHDMFRT